MDVNCARRMLNNGFAVVGEWPQGTAGRDSHADGMAPCFLVSHREVDQESAIDVMHLWSPSVTRAPTRPVGLFENVGGLK